MFMFLQCVGEAVMAKGMRGLMGAVPFAQQIFDVGADAIDRYRQRHRERRLASDLEEVIQAEVEQVREDAARIAKEVASGESDEVQSQLEAYLTQLPSVARQSLRRPEDLAGRTVPAKWQLEDPIQFSAVLPQRAPMFKSGERVPGASGWNLERLLGSGGFGEVWLGTHSFLDEQRAFKFCLDPYARERLLRHEGELVKRVMQASRTVQAHEHGIVPLMDAYLEGETPWLAYEFVEGGDLAGLVREWQTLNMERRAEYALKTLERLARIVGELHRLPEPIIHRDLKPANVLFRKLEAGHVIRVTDFGIGHVAADSNIRQATVTTPQVSLGETFRGSHTPIYASPQQEEGQKPDVRDDVHALGVIAWQMIVGNLNAKRPAGKWKKRVAGAQFSDEILDLLESCWDDDPDERPKDALEIVERITELRSPSAPLPPSEQPSNQQATSGSSFSADSPTAQQKESHTSESQDSTSGSFDMKCPGCAQRIAIPRKYADQQMICPLCQETFVPASGLQDTSASRSRHSTSGNFDMNCPGCAQRIAIPRKYAEEQMKCPLCQETFVPADLMQDTSASRSRHRSSGSFTATCPSCDKTLNVPGACAGEQVKCPLCLEIFVAPCLGDW